MHIGSISSVHSNPIRLHALKMPAKLRMPKLAMIHIKPVGNGATVIHSFGNFDRPKTFVFTSPKSMEIHIRKAIGSKWLNPSVGG